MVIALSRAVIFNARINAGTQHLFRLPWHLARHPLRIYVGIGFIFGTFYAHAPKVCLCNKCIGNNHFCEYVVFYKRS